MTYRRLSKDGWSANLRHFKLPVLCLLFLFIGMSLGIALYKHNIPPLPQLRFIRYFFFESDKLQKFLIGDMNVHSIKYTKGTPLFSDRDYYETLGPKELEGLTLIQIPRHYPNRLIIETQQPLVVYRFLSPANDDWLMSEYKKTDIKVNVVGATATHTQVAVKVFPPGLVVIHPGGPTTANPILIGPPRKEPPLLVNIQTLVPPDA